MKIVQILPELNEGGVERGTVELSRELVARGHQSIVISRGGKLTAQIEVQGGQHICLDVCTKNPLTLPSRIIQLRRVLRALKPSVVHARSRLPAWMTLLANRALRLPFVTTTHGMNSISRYSRVMTLGDRVICVSEVIQRYLCEHYAVAPEKLRVIQRGVDMQLFNPEHTKRDFITNFSENFALGGKYIVSSVGRITYLKDYESFIRAIAITRQKIPNICALIVGGARADNEDYLHRLEALAKAENVSDRIIFTGSQSHMPEIYQLSDVVVNASLKMGNVGRTVTESLAMDTPVIATTFKDLRNLVENNRNGFIVPNQDPQRLADAIMNLHQNPILHTRQTIDPEFTLDEMVARTLAVYHEVNGVAAA